jgi:nitrogen-specific signal transduction histidine kinase
MIGTIQDVTNRRQVEEEKRNLERQVQQAQKMESLGVLAGGIAHDFNNLLMAVLGHAELALDEISPMSPARGNLTEIATAARRAADLCRQMLAYAGRASFALERVGLRELVEEMAHLLKTAISKKAILNLNLERGLPPIEADPSQIRQIVMNLIINASEAIGDRSGVITVSVGATRCDDEYLRKTELRDDLAPGLYVHLEVTDTGSGMDAQTRSRIFEPFFSTKFTGRGLGLAAVLGIVRAHKGALKVYSEPGKGTTFKILFPALTEGQDATRPSESSPLADWRGKGTILLVDDEESLIALGGRMLEHLGFTVLTAADGLQAVELYRERGKEIDLVLMDLTMPHMDGAKAFGELRRLNPDVRVVLASGYSHEDVAARFAGKGLSGVLQKPYTLFKLRESLAGLMPGPEA